MNTTMASALAQIKIAMGIKCPYCGGDAHMVGGDVIYPHRPDLFEKKFWHCAPCNAYVGCHAHNPKLSFTGNEPLGRLANAELRAAKSAAHAAFDPIWQDGHLASRKTAYAWLADKLNIHVDDCHIGEFDVEQCKLVEKICLDHHYGLLSVAPIR